MQAREIVCSKKKCEYLASKKIVKNGAYYNKKIVRIQRTQVLILSSQQKHCIFLLASCFHIVHIAMCVHCERRKQTISRLHAFQFILRRKYNFLTND